MTPVTLWYRKNSVIDESWRYNHLENRHCENNTPTPINHTQKVSWQNRIWKRVLGYLDDSKPPKVMEISD